MAEILDQFKNQRNRYPWDEWKDGQPRRLTRGTDFHIDAKSFQAVIYQYADRNGLTVRTGVVDKNTVDIEFVLHPNSGTS